MTSIMDFVYTEASKCFYNYAANIFFKYHDDKHQK